MRGKDQRRREVIVKVVSLGAGMAPRHLHMRPSAIARGRALWQSHGLNRRRRGDNRTALQLSLLQNPSRSTEDYLRIPRLQCDATCTKRRKFQSPILVGGPGQDLRRGRRTGLEGGPWLRWVQLASRDDIGDGKKIKNS